MLYGKYVTLILFFLITSGLVWAQPGLPHQFYGTVTVNGNLADNASIVAKINGTEFGSTTSVNGNYGISPKLFFVTNPNGNNSGKTIEFFLNGSPVNEPTVVFENGGYTELNLSIGSGPVCGDGTCSGGETCSTCPADCGACDTGGGAPLGGGPGGGGGSPSLTIKIEGNCVGQDVTISTLNTYGNPSRDASILIRKGNKTVFEEKTDDDGKVVFTFDEAGEYTVFAVKQFYTQSSKTITISECAPGETTSPENGLDTGSEGTGNLCENINCDDGNPCTSEICATATGHCIYNNEENGTRCSATATCQEGICTEPEPETGDEETGPTGFFGLGTGQWGGLGLLVLAIIAMAGYLVALGKRKSK